MNFKLCCNKRAKKCEIILEELKDPKKEKNETPINYQKNAILITNDKNHNDIINNSNSNYEEEKFESLETKKLKKDMKTEKSILEGSQKSETKLVATNEKSQTQKNLISTNDNNLKIIIDETNTEPGKSLSSKSVNKNLNYFYSDKSERKNSKITNNSNFNINNTTKMDSVHSMRRDKEIESSFNAEFDKSFNSIGKVENKSISPIISKKKIEKKIIKKMREVDSMRVDLKKWAF